MVEVDAETGRLGTCPYKSAEMRRYLKFRYVAFDAKRIHGSDRSGLDLAVRIYVTDRNQPAKARIVFSRGRPGV